MATEYKWANPYKWLTDKTEVWTPARVREVLLAVLDTTEGQEYIEDAFQDEMEEDGYFIPTNAPLCSQCGEPTTSKVEVEGVEGPVCHDCREGNWMG